MSNGSETTPDSLSVFFPVFNDELTVRRVAEKALRVAAELTDRYEVVIVNDGSPDSSGSVADEVASEHEFVRVIHHPRNLGYGAAVRTGLAACRNEWICFTDGDDEYDLHDLRKLWKLRDYYDLIITFRYVRRYSGFRIVISQVYNRLLRRLFYLRFRDVSTGLRLVRKTVVDDIELHANSPFIGAEIAITTMLKGYRVGRARHPDVPARVRDGKLHVAGEHLPHDRRHAALLPTRVLDGVRGPARTPGSPGATRGERAWPQRNRIALRAATVEPHRARRARAGLVRRARRRPAGRRADPPFVRPRSVVLPRRLGVPGQSPADRRLRACCSRTTATG